MKAWPKADAIVVSPRKDSRASPRHEVGINLGISRQFGLRHLAFKPHSSDQFTARHGQFLQIIRLVCLLNDGNRQDLTLMPRTAVRLELLMVSIGAAEGEDEHNE
jgi:hypothetical protein